MTTAPAATRPASAESTAAENPLAGSARATTTAEARAGRAAEAKANDSKAGCVVGDDEEPYDEEENAMEYGMPVCHVVNEHLGQYQR